MSSPELLFLRALLTKAQVRLLPHYSLERISASLIRISLLPSQLIPQIRCSKPFLHCSNPSPLLPSLSADEIIFYSQRSLKPYTVNSQPPFSLIQNLFLSSSIFCSFLFLVSESHRLEKWSLPIPLLDSTHDSLLSGAGAGGGFLPPAARLPHILISP